MGEESALETLTQWRSSITPCCIPARFAGGFTVATGPPEPWTAALGVLLAKRNIIYLALRRWRPLLVVGRHRNVAGGCARSPYSSLAACSHHTHLHSNPTPGKRSSLSPTYTINVNCARLQTSHVGLSNNWPTKPESPPIRTIHGSTSHRCIPRAFYRSHRSWPRSEATDPVRLALGNRLAVLSPDFLYHHSHPRQAPTTPWEPLK